MKVTNGYGYEQPSYPYGVAEEDPPIWSETDDWPEGDESSLDLDEPLLGTNQFPANRAFSARRVARAFGKAEEKFERLEARVNALARRDRRDLDRLRERVNEISNDAVMGALLNQVTQETEEVTERDGNVVDVLVPPSDTNRLVGLLPLLTGENREGGSGRNNMMPAVMALMLTNQDEGNGSNDRFPLLMAMIMMMR